jgi:phosphate/sulfate permease
MIFYSILVSTILSVLNAIVSLLAIFKRNCTKNNKRVAIDPGYSKKKKKNLKCEKVASTSMKKLEKLSL